MKATNTRMKFAVQRLIRQYETGQHQGSSLTCPLCNAVDYSYMNDIEDCIACPNAAFLSDKFHGLPCVTRGERFKNLSSASSFANRHINDKRIVVFWKEVHTIMPDGRKKFVMTDELKADILRIARNVNRRKL